MLNNNSSENDQKQLKIKSGIVKRIFKELKMYEKEKTKQNEKIENMKKLNEDFHEVDQQVF